MRLSPEDARALATRAVGLTDADAAEVVVVSNESALTRFATNHIHQNVAESDTQVSVRAVLEKRQGVSSTNRLDDEGLSNCCASAVEAARRSTEDSDFPGLPAPADVEYRDRVRDATRHFGPEERAAAAKAIIDQSVERNLVAAGKVQISDYSLAVANSLGVDVGMGVTNISASVLSMGSDEGSGWASFAGSDTRDFAPDAMGDQAAMLAQRSEGPEDLEPDEYTVVLAPDAVADLVTFLAYEGFSAKAVEEGSSFMGGKTGQKLLSEEVSVFDDALAPYAMGPTFDFEGMPKSRTPLIEAGVAIQVVTDSYWAARTGGANTGHALPAPSYYGPLPLNLDVAAGCGSVDDLVASVKRGVYVTRFHYVNVEDPVRVVLTGMTRDGTFLIENGQLTRAIKNLRFTQSAVDALGRVTGVSEERALVGDEGISVMAPAMALERFAFTGQTR